MKFKNLPDYLSYKDFYLKAQVNTHTVCSAVFTIDPDKAEEFLSSAENRTKVEITSDSGNRIMNGFVYKADIRFGITRTLAELTILSESYFMQEKGENRIYQNPEKTFRDILKNYPDIEIGKSDNIDNKAEEIIYQYNTDDFTFVLMLAQMCDCGLWVDEEGKVLVGDVNNSVSFSDNEKDYEKSVIEKSITADKESRELSLLTMVQTLNGSKLKYGGSEYVIYSTEVTEKLDMVYFRYTASTKYNYSKDAVSMKNIITKGKVTDNKDSDNLGRIRAEFTEFEDKASEQKWLPYMTGYVGENNGGVVMLPDKGDTVAIHISDGFEFAAGSLREKALPDNCRDVDRKYFAMKETLVAFDTEQIQAKQSEYSTVTLVKDSVTTEFDRTKFTVNKECAVTELEKTRFKITKDDAELCQNETKILENKDTVKMTLDKSEFVMKKDSISVKQDKSEAVIKSDTIEIKTGKSAEILKNDKISLENGSGKLNIQDKKSVLEGGKSKLSLSDGKTELKGSSIDLNTQAVSV